ncbi:MAG TPA: hypothetical protein VMW43_01150 [Bacteroidota bacterium]|nr:hypothetical protein [Bacteroidota bacterium]
MQRFRFRPTVRYVDPFERWVPLLLKFCMYGFLGYLFYEAATTFLEYTPLQPWPGLLSTFRMFTFLPIHETGHLLFSFFGRTLHILGGSFWQVMFMVIWFGIAVYQRSQTAPVAAFFAGENLMDVSLYIRDAEFRALPLLGGRSSEHDWYNLLSDWNALSSAGTIADIVYYSGFAICCFALIGGCIFSIMVFLEPTRHPHYVDPLTARNNSVQDLLNKQISEKEKKELM